MLAFNWFFLEPTHTFHLREGENWLVLVLYLVVAVVASELAARARRRAREAQQREREAALLAEVAASLLGGGVVAEELDGIAASAAGVLGVSHAWISSAPAVPALRDAVTFPLVARDSTLGAISMPAPGPPDERIARGSCPGSRRCSEWRSTARSSSTRRSRPRRFAAAMRSRRRCSAPSRTTSARR